MVIEAIDVMDRMIEKILGNDKHYASEHHLMVKTCINLQNRYGKDCMLSVNKITENLGHNGKFFVKVHHLCYQSILDSDDVISCYVEIVTSLNYIKDEIQKHKIRRQKLAEYYADKQRCQQAELEKLYNQYS